LIARETPCTQSSAESLSSFSNVPRFTGYPKNPGEIIGLTYFRLHLPVANAA
jgi:hypothetical protein